MSESLIKNKINDAGLVTLDLGKLYVNGDRCSIDLVDFLEDGLIIKESVFRKKIKNLDISPLKNAFVAIFCSKDVIVPPWSYLLIQSRLLGVAQQVFFCNIEEMNLLLFKQALDGLKIKKYKHKRVFLKACGQHHVPLGGLSLCVHTLAPHVKSLFYGEPCSSIPLIKN